MHLLLGGVVVFDILESKRVSFCVSRDLARYAKIYNQTECHQRIFLMRSTQTNIKPHPISLLSDEQLISAHFFLIQTELWIHLGISVLKEKPSSVSGYLNVFFESQQQ